MSDYGYEARVKAIGEKADAIVALKLVHAMQFEAPESAAHLLAAMRGWTLTEAQAVAAREEPTFDFKDKDRAPTPWSTIHCFLVVREHLAQMGFQPTYDNALAVIMDWPVERARIALTVAHHAGYVSLGGEGVGAVVNHKRGRAKNQRAGCLLCKPHKANGVSSRVATPVAALRTLQEPAREVSLEGQTPWWDDGWCDSHCECCRAWCEVCGTPDCAHPNSPVAHGFGRNTPPRPAYDGLRTRLVWLMGASR